MTGENILVRPPVADGSNGLKPVGVGADIVIQNRNNVAESARVKGSIQSVTLAVSPQDGLVKVPYRETLAKRFDYRTSVVRPCVIHDHDVRANTSKMCRLETLQRYLERTSAIPRRNYDRNMRRPFSHTSFSFLME